jgi:hypothetical protein
MGLKEGANNDDDDGDDGDDADGSMRILAKAVSLKRKISVKSWRRYWCIF